jgi:hypothetical protein
MSGQSIRYKAKRDVDCGLQGQIRVKKLLLDILIAA